MKKILFLMFFLASLSYANYQTCVLAISKQPPRCIIDVVNAPYDGWSTVKYHSDGRLNTMSIQYTDFSSITTGYRVNTTNGAYEIDPNYYQVDITSLKNDYLELKKYATGEITYPKNPEPTDPTPTDPTPTDPTPTDPTPTDPTPIIPDENGLIMGLTPNDFHFSMALWGIVLAFLISFGLIKSI